MSSKLPFPPPGFDELTIDEQVEYLQALWDRIMPREGEISVPDWHMEIVQERLARYEANGIEGTPWKEFEKELIEQLIKG